MAEGPRVIASEGGGDTPFEYQLSPGESIRPEAVSATFDGSGAGGAFLPSLAIYLSSGELVSRTFPDEAVPAGDSAEVTFAPF